MEKWQGNLLLVGTIGLAAYILYRKFTAGSTPAETQATFQNSGLSYTPMSSQNSLGGYTGKVQTQAHTDQGLVNRTYFFTSQDNDKFNWAQRFLISTGVPVSWVLE
jgi:hypothetical protein